MSQIHNLLNEIRGRVPMYVGSNSLAKLATFLRGFKFALDKYGLAASDDFLSRFQDWIQQRFAITLSKSWEKIILFHSVDDNEAIETFWTLIDEYLREGNAGK